MFNLKNTVMDERIKRLKQEIIFECVELVNEISNDGVIGINIDKKIVVEPSNSDYFLTEIVVDSPNMWLISTNEVLGREIITNCRELCLEDIDFNVLQVLLSEKN